jgi:alcohol dehydrogenase
MKNIEYKALFVREIEENKFQRSIETLQTAELPQNGVLIRVLYSSLNYKDALSASGHKGITRSYPFQPGIDAAGIVESSNSDLWKPGDEVIVTGHDLGMNTYGGFGQFINVPAEWIVPRPAGLSLKQAMMYGTAGFTAGVSVYELQRNNVTPGSTVLVTGASGGVGSISVAILSKLGYKVIASTGKKDTEFFSKLGNPELIDRSEVNDKSGRPLLSGRWHGAIDTVGGNTLSTVIRSTKQRGCVTVMGNVESNDLNITVMPFLLRGVTIQGIDSASRPMDLRRVIWMNLSEDWKVDLSFMIKEVGLSDLSTEIDTILKGGQKGRVVVDLWK